MSEPVQKITADKLCAITGLTDRRHRQLASSGYFPPPVRGEYQLGPTLRGMFKFYRETLAKREVPPDEAVSAYKAARARRETAEADAAEVEAAVARKQVIPVAEVLALWQSVGFAIRRVVLTSELSAARQDAILRELEALKDGDVMPSKKP